MDLCLSRPFGIESPAPIEIVLVRPKRGGNVAATARAMKNMGLARLALVDARMPSVEERALAYGALDILDAARRVSVLSEALARCVFVGGASARAGGGEWSPRDFASEATKRRSAGPVAVVFGPEDSGLRNDELRLCHVRVRIPSALDHSSLNLAQAVLIIAYELRLAGLAGFTSASKTEPANVSELEGCLKTFRDALLSIGYLNPENPGAILSELRGLIARAQPSSREVTLLRGMARQILWAAHERGAFGREVVKSTNASCNRRPCRER
ncbi:MAG: RNA methyltransferase [Vicinamibacteria bacterium]|nr:RNA methyltransferase [Vicinamibacteria bacterium]